MAALSQRDAQLSETGAHPGPPSDVPAEATCVLHLQLCLPRAAKLSAEPSFAATAESMGTIYLEKPGDCSFPKAGARFTPVYHLICTAFWGSVAHL